MNLHSGNILISKNSSKIKLVDFENFFFELPIRNEQYFFYLIELFLDEYRKNYDKQSAMLSDIFTPKFNVFEMIDIVSFGRVVYEMYTGKELKAPYPDELEYFEMEENIKEVLRSIFPLKTRSTNNSKVNYVGYPEISVQELLKKKLFSSCKSSDETIFDKDKKNKKQNPDLLKDEKLMDNERFNLKLEFDGLSYIKEDIYNQQRFINQQYGKINTFKN